MCCRLPFPVFCQLNQRTQSRTEFISEEHTAAQHSRKPSWVKQAQQKAQRRFSAVTIQSVADSIIGNFIGGDDAKIIFLDVDGVLNHPTGQEVVTTVCPKCVNKLKGILEQTSAMIVLSTTWRLNKRNRKTLFRYLRAVDMDQGVVVGMTRDLAAEGKNRAEEINDWLTKPNLINSTSSWNPQQMKHWVSLDDLDLSSLQPNEKWKSNHIKLDPKLGLCGTENIVRTVVQGLTKTTSIDGSCELTNARDDGLPIDSSEWPGKEIKITESNHSWDRNRRGSWLEKCVAGRLTNENAPQQMSFIPEQGDWQEPNFNDCVARKPSKYKKPRYQDWEKRNLIRLIQKGESQKTWLKSRINDYELQRVPNQKRQEKLQLDMAFLKGQLDSLGDVRNP